MLGMGFRMLEVWLVARLLSSPTFHRAVKGVHRKVHEIRTGEKVHDYSEMGGTNIDKLGPSDFQKFRKHFVQEIRDQIRGNTKK